MFIRILLLSLFFGSFPNGAYAGYCGNLLRAILGLSPKPMKYTVEPPPPTQLPEGIAKAGEMAEVYLPGNGSIIGTVASFGPFTMSIREFGTAREVVVVNRDTWLWVSRKFQSKQDMLRAALSGSYPGRIIQFANDGQLINAVFESFDGSSGSLTAWVVGDESRTFGLKEIPPESVRFLEASAESRHAVRESFFTRLMPGSYVAFSSVQNGRYSEVISGKYLRPRYGAEGIYGIVVWDIGHGERFIPLSDKDDWIDLLMLTEISDGTEALKISMPRLIGKVVFLEADTIMGTQRIFVRIDEVTNGVLRGTQLSLVHGRGMAVRGLQEAGADPVELSLEEIKPDSVIVYRQDQLPVLSSGSR